MTVLTEVEVTARVRFKIEVADLDDADAIYTAAIEALPLGVDLDDIESTDPRSAVS
jgi:hypothetical protein